MRMVADAIYIAEAQSGCGGWLKTLTSFKIAQAAVNSVLERVAPKDDLPPSLLSEDLERRAIKVSGEAVATALWRAVQQADAALPLNQGTEGQAQLSVAKQDLALILKRTINPVHDVHVLRDSAGVQSEMIQAAADLREKMRQTRKDTK
jgi:hypothetical protein